MPAPAADTPAAAVKISDVWMPRLFFELLRRRFTGTVELLQPAPYSGSRSVWVRGGMPLFTDWVAPQDVLGQVLLDERRIKQAQLDQALRTMIGDERLLGDVLCETQVIDEHELIGALRLQCERKLVRSFELRDGEAVLRARDPNDDVRLSQVGVLSMIRKGVRHHYEPPYIEEAMGPVLAGPLATVPEFDRHAPRFSFTWDDVPLVEALRQGCSFAELCKVPGATRRRAMQVVFTLWCCDMLAVGQAALDRIREVRSARSTMPKTAAQPRARARKTSNPAVFMALLKPIETRIAADGHAFALLDLTTDADADAVENAYHKLARRADPDGAPDEDSRRQARLVHGALTRAYDLLRNPTGRAELARLVDDGGTGSELDGIAGSRARGIDAARNGHKLLRANRIGEALDQFAVAAREFPDVPDHRAAIVWCKFLGSRREPDHARSAASVLGALVKNREDCACAHYYLGMLCLELGREDRALRCFSRAQKADPELLDAERQVRAIRARQRSTRR